MGVIVNRALDRTPFRLGCPPPSLKPMLLEEYTYTPPAGDDTGRGPTHVDRNEGVGPRSHD